MSYTANVEYFYVKGRKWIKSSERFWQKTDSSNTYLIMIFVCSTYIEPEEIMEFQIVLLFFHIRVDRLRKTNAYCKEPENSAITLS